MSEATASTEKGTPKNCGRVHTASKISESPTKLLLNKTDKAKK
jgi:hypothetical protein